MLFGVFQELKKNSPLRCSITKDWSCWRSDFIIINRCDGRRQRNDWILPWEIPQPWRTACCLLSKKSTETVSTSDPQQKPPLFKKNILPMTGPSEIGPEHSGTRSLLRVPVFLSLLLSPILSVMDFWGWSSVYFHLLPRCAAPASGRR